MLEKGFNYLLYEEKASISYELVAELAKEGSPTLCITTVFPKKLKKLYPLGDAEVLWLSDSGSDPKALKPTRLDFEITRTITRFLKDTRVQSYSSTDSSTFCRKTVLTSQEDSSKE